MKKKLSFILTGLMLAVVFMPTLALAQGFNTDDPTGGQAGFFESLFGEDIGSCDDAQCVIRVLVRILIFLLSLAFVVALIFFVWGGFRYMTAHGNDEYVQSAKKTMSRAIIGVILIAAAWAILRIILTFVEEGTP